MIFDFMTENASGYVGDNHKEVIETKAAEIMKIRVKFKDACHVASAIYARCEYFITTDIRLLKYHTEEIRMVTPIEFVTEMEDFHSRPAIIFLIEKFCQTTVNIL